MSGKLPLNPNTLSRDLQNPDIRKPSPGKCLKPAPWKLKRESPRPETQST